jgi:hypothetical protein
MRRLMPPSLQIANAAEDQLRADSALDEKWETGCVWVIIAGLALEGVLVGVHAPYDSVLTRWGSFVCDALIALGVYFEVHFGGRIRQRDHELVRRSNERVAKAEDRTKQIELIAGWRQITADQHEKLVSGMRELAPSLQVFVQIQRDNTEAYMYGLQIFKALHAAGVNYYAGTNSFFDPIFGLHISVEPPLDIGAIVQIFNAAGLHVVVHSRPPSAYARGGLPAANMYMFVAPKPPPDFNI